MANDPNPNPPDRAHWLDPIIAEQASYYNLTVEQYGRMSRERAELCESITEDMEG